METSEKALFLEAARAPVECIPDPDNAGWMGEYDSFSGLQAVIKHRLHDRSLEQLKKAVELFNYTSDCGLFYSDPAVPAVIKVGNVAEVGPILLERILYRLPADEKSRDESSAFDKDFFPLARVLTTLKEELESPSWVENDLALKLFIYIAALYRAAIQCD